jgi:hypothetical protein
MSFQIKVLTAIACIGLALVLPMADAWAQDDELQLKRSFGLRGSGESHVQVRAILAPVKRKASSLSTAKIPVTPVLTVIEKDQVGHVSKLGPRITDALLQAWYAKPMTLQYLFDPSKSTERIYKINKTPYQQAEDARLIKANNQSLGANLVTEVLVLKGARAMGGGAISKLPFASVLGCAELEQSAPTPEGS